MSATPASRPGRDAENRGSPPYSRQWLTALPDQRLQELHHNVETALFHQYSQDAASYGPEDEVWSLDPEDRPSPLVVDDQPNRRLEELERRYRLLDGERLRRVAGPSPDTPVPVPTPQPRPARHADPAVAADQQALPPAKPARWAMNYWYELVPAHPPPRKLPGLHDPVDVRVGWDADRATFFAQVSKEMPGGFEDDYTLQVVRLGTRPYEVRTARQALEAVRGWAIVPAWLETELERDAGPPGHRLASIPHENDDVRLGGTGMATELTADDTEALVRLAPPPRPAPAAAFPALRRVKSATAEPTHPTGPADTSAPTQRPQPGRHR